MTPESPTPLPPPLPSGAPASIAGYCRACGKALDQSSVRTAGGTIYCQEHLPMDTAQGAASPYTASSSGYGSGSGYGSAPSSNAAVANPEVSPGLAFILGWIPGVGAIYNGQYIKGLIHVAIIGLTISILSSRDSGNFTPLIALLLAAFWFYMPFEAYHTAKYRRSGQAVDQVSSLVPMGGGASKFPAAPVILIALGSVLLLDNLGLLDLGRALRYWPALLIVAGVYMLYVRVAYSRDTPPTEAKR